MRDLTRSTSHEQRVYVKGEDRRGTRRGKVREGLRGGGGGRDGLPAASYYTRTGGRHGASQALGSVL